MVTDTGRGVWVDPVLGKDLFGDYARNWLGTRSDLEETTGANGPRARPSPTLAFPSRRITRRAGRRVGRDEGHRRGRRGRGARRARAIGGTHLMRSGRGCRRRSHDERGGGRDVIVCVNAHSQRAAAPL